MMPLTADTRTPDPTDTLPEAPAARQLEPSPRQVTAVWATLAFVGLVWCSHLLAVTRTPAQDNLEQLLWVQSLQWGYYKHPPLTTWLLWPFVQLLGDHDAVPAVLGTVMVLSALAIAWRLCWRMGLGRLATLGLLATLCNSYYSARLDMYNHNVVLLLFFVASAAASWRVFQRQRLIDWAMLGAVLGGGFLVKYQMVLVLPCIAALWVLQRGWLSVVHRRGPWLALGLAAALVAPHLVWLVANDFPPMGYAMQSSLGARLSAVERPGHAGLWALDQLFNRALPGLLLLGLLVLAQRWLRTGTAADRPPPVAALGRSIILLWGWLPLCLMVLMNLLGGSTLQRHWGVPFMAFTMPALLLQLPALPAARLSQVSWRWAGAGFLLVQALVMADHLRAFERAVQAVEQGRLQTRFAWRVQTFEALSAEVHRAALRQLGRAVPVVRGSPSVAIAVSRRLPSRPVVLVDGPVAWSPWAPALADQACAAAWLDAEPPAGAQVLAQGAVEGRRWSLVAARQPQLACPVP